MDIMVAKKKKISIFDIHVSIEHNMIINGLESPDF